MIIIAGTGSPKVEKYISKSIQHCLRCNNNRQWILQKNVFYITLFFLPVAPYKTTYTFSCPICGNKIELDKEKFDYLVSHDAEPLKM
jgi:hypothetical protein